MPVSGATSASKQADTAGKELPEPEKDPGDPGAGYEWVTTQWIEEVVDRTKGIRRTYQANEVYEGEHAAEYINPDPEKYGASGPLIRKRKIRTDSGSANTEGN